MFELATGRTVSRSNRIIENQRSRRTWERKKLFQQEKKTTNNLLQKKKFPKEEQLKKRD
jgi:hypothetical protein